MTQDRKCPKCGTPLSPDAPEGLCPKCLLAQSKDSTYILAGAKDTPKASAADFDPPSPEELGKHFPQLEILELLGKGGMGAVYKARQTSLDRFVALKVLPPSVAKDPTFAERFSREAKALAKLGHPNIVMVHDFGQAGEFYYFLMEFVDGVNLRQAIKAKELEPRQALRIVTQICDALQFAHEQGVVHRDIKPENILLDKKGSVKIADFGLAKLVGSSRADFTLTGTGQVMGTPHYMAPEQMEKPLEVDQRSDIYSLGVVFYEMLTGELPLGRFAPPSQKVQVDVRIDEVVLRTLEREPARRYQSAGEVRTQVESISQAAPAPRERRNAAWLWSVVLFVVAVAAIVEHHMSIRETVPLSTIALIGIIGLILAVMIIDHIKKTRAESITKATAAPVHARRPRSRLHKIIVTTAVVAIAVVLTAFATIVVLSMATGMRTRIGGDEGLVFSAEGPTIGRELAQTLDLRPMEEKEVNQAIQEAHRKYVALEEKHTNVSKDDQGRVHVTVSPFSTDVKAIEKEVWSKIDAVLDERQRAVARRHLPLGELLPYGDGETTMEIWHEGISYHWKAKTGGLLMKSSSSGSSPVLFNQYKRFWDEAQKGKGQDGKSGAVEINADKLDLDARTKESVASGNVTVKLTDGSTDKATIEPGGQGAAVRQVQDRFRSIAVKVAKDVGSVTGDKMNPEGLADQLMMRYEAGLAVTEEQAKEILAGKLDDAGNKATIMAALEEFEERGAVLPPVCMCMIKNVTNGKVKSGIELEFYARIIRGHLDLATGQERKRKSYFVSPSGTDRNPGTEKAPFRSIQFAINSADPGGRIVVCGGTYAESIQISKPVQLEGKAGEKAVLSSNAEYGIGITSDDVSVANIAVSGCGKGILIGKSYVGNAPEGKLSNVTIDGVSVERCNFGIYVAMCENLTVTNCTLSDLNADAIWVSFLSDYAVISNNRLTNIGDQGIWLGGHFQRPDVYANNGRIVGNTVTNVRESGIIYSGEKCLIQGNTVTGVRGDGHSVGAIGLLGHIAKDVQIVDNVIRDNLTAGIGVKTKAENIVVRGNQIHNNKGPGLDNQTDEVIDARENWWGDASGPADPEGNPEGKGEKVNGKVNYKPWRKEKK